MKLHALRNEPERRPQDLVDLAFLLRLPDIDQEEVRAYFERHGMVSEYERPRA